MKTTGRTPPHKVSVPPLSDPGPPSAGEGSEGMTDGGPGGFTGPRGPSGQRLSLPFDSAAARPASRRATGIRKGEQET
ncbi:hypothetical protein Shyd_24890 [Streptomyces hydrogenans]|uniref:Uncharacterized protein n=1 Tax=Streptomyces hydrogenans TaxID=1873719 RepID=A0ABQ3P7V8_9ACTN|nr:hypothetical protein GCM10018784_43530 [Streptomyces hydrogenans]GHI21118.1 hypothetical protein Shyd_24890 [Streptomyces hydrogenans]